MYYVYVLSKGPKGPLYIGYSRDVEQRLRQHKLSDKDWQLIYYEAYVQEKSARDRERKLKMYGSAWRGLKQRIAASLMQTA